jgi:uncharacterized integral membrane protein
MVGRRQRPQRPNSPFPIFLTFAAAERIAATNPADHGPYKSRLSPETKDEQNPGTHIIGPMGSLLSKLKNLAPGILTPKAQAKSDFTDTCRLCRSSLEDTACVRGPSGDWFHAGCLRRLLELPETPQKCRHCDALVGVTININAIEVNSCVRCGSPDPVESVSCGWCGLPLYPWQEAFVGVTHLTCYVHDGCEKVPKVRSAATKAAIWTFFIVLALLLVMVGVLAFHAWNPEQFLMTTPPFAALLAAFVAGLVWIATWIAQKTWICLRRSVQRHRKPSVQSPPHG